MNSTSEFVMREQEKRLEIEIIVCCR